MPDRAEPRGIRVPLDQLSPEALRSLVEEFVTRDGTDYGAIERSVEQKIEHVMRQLDSGEVLVVFDPETETTNLVLARELHDD